MKNPDPIYFEDESRTVQSDLPKTQIHNILRQYNNNGGVITHLNQAQAAFKDVTEFTDLKDVLNQAREAEKAFMALPSKVREQFDHDVAVWLDTAHDLDKRAALLNKDAGHGEQLEHPDLLPEGSTPSGDD